MNPNYRPVGTRVYVRMTENDVDGHAVGFDVRTQGGIHLLNNERSKSQTGVIDAVGAGKENEDGDFIEVRHKKGEKVILDSSHGTEIVLDGQRYRVVDDSDVLAIIEGE